MRKDIASVGLILVLIAAFLFFIVFSGGKLFGLTVTGTSELANFAAFLYVIVALPIGSAMTYVGLAFRPMYAAGAPQQIVYKSSSGLAGAALAVAIIALIVAFAAIGISYSGVGGGGASNSAVSSVANQVNSLNAQVSTLNAQVANGTVNVQPSAIAYKIDWCNTDNVGQDRFCPNVITVDQGDVVQILFISNDTDIHTFTLLTSPYSFQINATAPGMHDFLNNENVPGGCSNSGTPAQQTAAISGTYCVSGSSLLTPSELQSTGASTYRVAQNPNPASPLNGTTPLLLNVDNQLHVDNASASAQAAGSTEIWGIGAFQATAPGIYEYFCHYHVSNGMFGYLIVLPNAYCATHASACNVAG